ncbi:hypothetical protein HCG83_05125 [Enterococcus casseliflavus]|uniref:hypothetical protein n=1 Tax=Enterococcus casseliflavus TaxID=37734 RepID=UPI001C8CED30|nr:hypothetical protein [Enterococcus casseliflavus]MBX9115686.1 hypothetical protein [Enterococcus casseliflavus]MBX9126586.1 hypothetical protein [Enterococcus casseliflavus]
MVLVVSCLLLIFLTHLLLEKNNAKITLAFWKLLLVSLLFLLSLFFLLIRTLLAPVFILLLIINCTVIQNRFMYQYRPKGQR